MENNSSNTMGKDLLQVVKKSIEIYKQHFSVFLVIGILFGCVNVLTSALMSVLAVKSMSVFVICNLLFTSIATIAVIEASSRALFGKSMELKVIFQKVSKKYVAFVTVTATVLVLASLGAFFFVIPGLLCLTFFVFADVLIVCEDIDFKGALQKSIEMVKPVFWMVVVFNVILYSVLLLLIYMLQPAVQEGSIVERIINVIILVVIPPVFNLLKVVLYYGCKSDEEVSLSESGDVI